MILSGMASDVTQGLREIKELEAELEEAKVALEHLLEDKSTELEKANTDLQAERKRPTPGKPKKN